LTEDTIDVLQFEIVTPDGEFRIANAYQNEDLFWALRGGGPGFGVVTKVTYKTHPAITQMVWLNVTINYTPQSYPNLMRTYLSLQPMLSAQNFSGYTYPVKDKDSTTNTNTWWSIWVVPNSADIAGSNSAIKPIFDLVQSETNAGRPMSISNQSAVLPSYLAMWPDNPKTAKENTAINQILGSRLLPVSAFEGNLDAFVDLLNTTDVTPMFLH
ncbi:12306_t:CDS:2, partial [Acaulospora colombiana]